MRILIVDDESLNRFMLLHMLEEAGYPDCFEAETGREALQLAKKIRPDLVLLDVVMPDMDGYEVAPLLKKMAGDIYLPVIFITAMDDQAALTRCLEVGGDDFATKPFDRNILTAKIRAHARTRLLSIRTNKQNRELNYFRKGVEREHAIVEHIFANALTLNPGTKRFFDYRLAPASTFNGDVFLSEPSPSGGLYFLMGDFTGHGLASAVGALPVARAFQAMSRKGLSVSEISQTLNEILLSLLPEDMFFAAVVVEISVSGQQFSVWNGGMPDLAVVTPEGRISKRFISLHMALGILEVDDFEENIEYFNARLGDRLIGYSDGVIELTNAEEQMLGDEAILSWLTSDPAITVEEISHRTEKFRGKAEQLDDITLISYTCQDLSELKSQIEITQLPFTITVELKVEQLIKFTPIYDIVVMVCSQLGMQRVRSDLSTVISELFMNSLDHGILKLDSNIKKSTEGFFEYFKIRNQRLQKLKQGEITISIGYEPQATLLSIKLSDSGDGFDYQRVQSNQESDTYGRGISLIKTLCQSVQYFDEGRSVLAKIKV
ncbi:SpoIIE family protein phosphatase [Aliiglaciecola sp. 3_MG-2023]|uniref:ATP-binding SpoIIE family protein phosphatase n=1 Tax=Aliiglaciecola sp. 3_MG-2023 TaxID=3062644 RepID=UPI0026E490E4|nr:SpoIIE family protein phosphatase [Aliiglaciecola sp. 3_MG-2023]MDO6691662.1 SpoIIE family protein phosphatase [Aliiglaciecola sp. 3_MG-2023]